MQSCGLQCYSESLPLLERCDCLLTLRGAGLASLDGQGLQRRPLGALIAKERKASELAVCKTLGLALFEFYRACVARSSLNQQEIKPCILCGQSQSRDRPAYGTNSSFLFKSQCDQHIAAPQGENSPREVTAMAKQDAPVDPKVQKWLEENAISTGKADINLVVTD